MRETLHPIFDSSFLKVNTFHLNVSKVKRTDPLGHSSVISLLSLSQLNIS